MVTEPTWEAILLENVEPNIEYKGAAPWRLPEASGGSGVLIRTNKGTIIRPRKDRETGTNKGIKEGRKSRNKGTNKRDQ